MWLGSNVVVKSNAESILVDHECLCLGCLHGCLLHLGNLSVAPAWPMHAMHATFESTELPA